MLRTVLQTSGASLRALGSTRFPATCRALAAASSSSPPPDESNKSDSSAQRRRVSADYSAVDNESSSGGHSIVIDRSGLFQFAEPTQSTGDDAASTAAARAVEKEAETEMAKHVKAMIQFRGGPLTVAEYMKEVLTNPIAGFYMGEQVIGSSGDFITSPEISQMFGEMVGIWTVCMWQQMGCPERLRIVELGPGKGTLMADLLRGTKPFAPFQSALDIRLVEVGTGLRKAQWRTLQCGEEGSEMEEGVEASVSRIGGAPIQWHRTLQDIPSDTPTVYIAHEFLDALPVHQFQRSEGGNGWSA